MFMKHYVYNNCALIFDVYTLKRGVDSMVRAFSEALNETCIQKEKTTYANKVD